MSTECGTFTDYVLHCLHTCLACITFVIHSRIYIECSPEQPGVRPLYRWYKLQLVSRVYTPDEVILDTFSSLPCTEVEGSMLRLVLSRRLVIPCISWPVVLERKLLRHLTVSNMDYSLFFMVAHGIKSVSIETCSVFDQLVSFFHTPSIFL